MSPIIEKFFMRNNTSNLLVLICLVFLLSISSFSKEAAATDVFRDVESFIRYFISPSSKKSQGITPLMEAAKKGDVEKINQLISSGAVIEAKSKYGYTPLVFATLHGRKSAVIALLDAGANPNVITKRIAKNTQGPTPEYTPLYAALSQIQFILIDTYTKPGEEEKKKNSSKAYEEIADILLDRGAKPDMKSFAQAARLGMLDLMKKMQSTNNDDFININPKALYVGTPICAAARSGSLETVKWLIKMNADPNVCASLTAASNMRITQFLIDHGADRDKNLIPSITTLAYVDWGNRDIDLVLEKISLYVTNGVNTNVTMENPPNVRHKSDPPDTNYKNLTIKEFLLKITDKMQKNFSDRKKSRMENPNSPYHGPSDEQYVKTIENINRAYKILFAEE